MVRVSTNSGLNQGNWVHLALRVDYEEGKLALYLDGQLSDESFLSNGAPLELTLRRSLVLGGTQQTWRNFFNGES